MQESALFRLISRYFARSDNGKGSRTPRTSSSAFDTKRRIMTIIFTALIVVLLATIGGFIILDKGDSMTGYVIGSVIAIALVSLLVDAHFKGQMHTAVEATNAGMSYDNEGLVVTERWRSKFYLRKSKARSQFDKS